MTPHRVGYVSGESCTVAWDDIGVPAIACDALRLLGIECREGLDLRSADASLAAAISTICAALSLQLPCDVVAAARLDILGGVRPLPIKASTVVEALVPWPNASVLAADSVRYGGGQGASSHADNLRSAMREANADRILGIESLSEALDLLVGLRERAVRGTLIGDPGARSRAERALFDAVLGRCRTVLDWSIIAAAAIGLLRGLEVGGDEEERERAWQLEFVRDVARRHDGLTAPIAWPEPEFLERYDEAERMAIIAHVVQSVADGEFAAVPEYLANAKALVDGASSAGAIKILGACGRASAAVGLFADARELLTAALRGWMRQDPAEGSYALCELLRVVAILGDAAAVKKLVENETPIVFGACGGEGRSFIALATGRALAQVGEARIALDWLERPEVAEHARLHVQTGAARWDARAARSLGDQRRVERSRGALRALAGGASAQRFLADADDAVACGVSCAAVLEELLSLPVEGQEARRQLARLAPGSSARAIAGRINIVRRFLDEYRY
jgi:hypothetical protein